MLNSNNNLLYTGKLPDDSCYEPEFCEKFSEIRKVPAKIKDAAMIFLLNVPSWRDNAFIRENCADSEIREMENELSKLSSTGEKSNDRLFIEWGLRQIALRKSSY